MRERVAVKISGKPQAKRNDAGNVSPMRPNHRGSNLLLVFFKVQTGFNGNANCSFVPYKNSLLMYGILKSIVIILDVTLSRSNLGKHLIKSARFEEATIVAYRSG